VDYANLTDAELRAQILLNPYGTEPLVEEVMRRFCDTTKLDNLHKTVEKAESLAALLESRIADVSSCIGDIRDYLQRATE